MSNLDNFIEDLKRQIEEFGDLSEDEIVRFIYLSLGRKIVFDTNWFFFRDDYGERRKEIYNKSLEEWDNSFILDNEQTSAAICKIMALALSYIGEKLNKKIKIVEEQSDIHVFPHVYNKVIRTNGTSYYMDLYGDLKNIHSNSRTRYFGMPQHYGKYFFDRDELERIDLKIGYITKDKYYSDDYLDLLKNYISYFDTFSEKLKFILENYSPYPEYNSGFFEHRQHIIEDILEEVFNEEERKKYDYLDCKIYDYKKIIKDNNGTRLVYNINARGLIYDIEGDFFYALLEKEGRYKPISLEELAEMIVDNKMQLPTKYRYKNREFPGYLALEKAKERYIKQKRAFEDPYFQ